jgi:hypothetical protein
MSEAAKSGKMEFIANLATTVAAVLLAVVVVKTYLLPASSAGSGPFAARPAIVAQQAIVEGTSLKGRLAGVDWSRNGQTLVLAISTHCHFCTESTPFFRQIAKEKKKDIKLLAVLPESVAEGEQYLNGEGVHVDHVSQVSLDSAGIPGTPMMLLVDSGGVVRNSWTGKLEPPVQEQVLSLLR